MTALLLVAIFSSAAAIAPLLPESLLAELPIAARVAAMLRSPAPAAAQPPAPVSPVDPHVTRSDAPDPGYAAPICSIDGPSSGLDCGDGILAAGEQCDDANFLDGDGCSTACTVEAGFACSGEASSCHSICGNGLLDAGETCDDGDQVEADGCSPACRIDDGWVCAGSPSECRPACGDGVVVGTEQCDDAEANGSDLSCCTEGCTLVPTGTACDDGQVCTAGDTCNSRGRCSGAEPVTCDDGNVCTDEICDPDEGCRYVIRQPPCDKPAIGLGLLGKRAEPARRFAMPKRSYDAPVRE